MIDIHSHILPGIDDGADCLDTSVMMAMMAVNSGVQAIVTTPHCNIPSSYQNYYSQALLDRFFTYQEVLKNEEIPLKLFLGMEIYGTEEVPWLLERKQVIPLNNSRYPLIEFGFGEDPEYVNGILRGVKEKGYIPVIAHPERYSFVQENPHLVNEWIEAGYLTQVNKGSIMGRFGKRIHVLARQLLDQELVTCVASDAHSSGFRTPSMDEIMECLTLEYSPSYAKKLLLQNPYLILGNQRIKMKQVSVI